MWPHLQPCQPRPGRESRLSLSPGCNKHIFQCCPRRASGELNISPLCGSNEASILPTTAVVGAVRRHSNPFYLGDMNGGLGGRSQKCCPGPAVMMIPTPQGSKEPKGNLDVHSGLVPMRQCLPLPCKNDVRRKQLKKKAERRS